MSRTVLRKAQRIHLEPRASVKDAALAAVAEGRAHLLHNVSGLSRNHDPELVHQSRVALRRLRVFVRLFRSTLGESRAEQLAVELSWLFASLGKLRDLQVFARDFLPLERPRERARLRARVERRSQAARRELERALKDPRFAALCAELASLQAELEQPTGQRKRARPFLARRLQRRRKRALRHAQAALRGDMDALHEMRKELKKLRYTSELARDLYASRKPRVREYLRALSELQDVLGALIDLHVAHAALAKLDAPAQPRAHLAAQLDADSRSRLAKLDDALAPFAAAEPFWS